MRTLVLRVGAVGMAAALMLWLYQRTEPAAADTQAAAYPTSIVPAAPSPISPARLVTPHGPRGAAAPPAVRNPYSNDNSGHFR